jgi:hypothetical protein
MGCEVSLIVVHCLEALVKSWRVCDSDLEMVHCRDASIRTPMDCWADFMKVPIDCVTVWMEMTWEGSLAAVHCRAVVVRKLTCSEGVLVDVQNLATWLITFKG